MSSFIFLKYFMHKEYKHLAKSPQRDSRWRRAGSLQQAGGRPITPTTRHPVCLREASPGAYRATRQIQGNFRRKACISLPFFFLPQAHKEGSFQLLYQFNFKVDDTSRRQLTREQQEDVRQLQPHQFCRQTSSGAQVRGKPSKERDAKKLSKLTRNC